MITNHKEEADQCISGNTPWMTISAQIYTDIKNNKEKTDFVKFVRPVRFGLKDFIKKYNEDKEENLEIDNSEDIKTKNKLLERKLHKYLSSYVYVKGDETIYTKTLFHENSKKQEKGKNEWLFPDIVGVKFQKESYDNESTRFLFDVCKVKTIELYSFELKKEIKLSDLSEFYFQAVSNSSWANYGYLVVNSINEDDDNLMEKMSRLCESFGIGVIKLNLEHFSQSKVLFEAVKRNNLDFTTIDYLTTQSNEFKQFIENINKMQDDKKYKEVASEQFFDEVYSIEKEDEAKEDAKKHGLLEA